MLCRRSLVITAVLAWRNDQRRGPRAQRALPLIVRCAWLSHIPSVRNPLLPTLTISHLLALDCTLASQEVIRTRDWRERGDLLDTNDPDRLAEEDAVVEAIDDVSIAVEDSVSDQEDLLSELGRIRHDRVAGVPLQESIGGTGQPRALVLLNRVTNRLSLGSARLRRALVTSLVKDGESVNSVAKRFEVTHQRISSILRRDKDE